jgi:hypothetical protein
MILKNVRGDFVRGSETRPGFRERSCANSKLERFSVERARNLLHRHPQVWSRIKAAEISGARGLRSGWCVLDRPFSAGDEEGQRFESIGSRFSEDHSNKELERITIQG